MGDEYTVVGPESPQYINHLVETIETKIAAVKEAHGDAKLSKTQLAILVALQIADQLEKLRFTHEKIGRIDPNRQIGSRLFILRKTHGGFLFYFLW